MAYTLEDKVDYLFKQSQSKTRGSNDVAFFEENIPSSLEVHANAVFAETVPQPAPNASTVIVKRHYPVDEGGDDMIHLTMDRAVNGGRKWVALDNFEAVWSSGSGDVSRVLKNFITNAYHKSYVVKVFAGNGDQISELDDSSWLFNYRAGVLTFESDRAESGSSESDCIKIKAFQYIGKMQSDVVSRGTSVSRLRAELIGIKDDTNVDFRLPNAVDVTMNYGIEFNGHEIYVGDDFTVDIGDDHLIHLNESPEDFDALHVLYYPV